MHVRAVHAVDAVALQVHRNVMSDLRPPRTHAIGIGTTFANLLVELDLRAEYVGRTRIELDVAGGPSLIGLRWRSDDEIRPKRFSAITGWLVRHLYDPVPFSEHVQLQR